MGYESLADVEVLVSYIMPTARKPFSFDIDPPAGLPRRSAAYRDYPVRNRNARDLQPAPTLDAQGFALRRHATRVTDFYDKAEVERVYYPELRSLVKKEATGARTVVVFDHTVRGDTESDRPGTRIHQPVSRVHNDYTATPALNRMRDVVPPQEAERLLRHRVMEVNVWRPIRGPLRTKPLAMVDARSLGPGDLVACDLICADRVGEIYCLAHRPEHEWNYFPDMRREEVLLLKGFDTDASVTQFGPHAAFRHTNAPASSLPRESIEARTLAFFAPIDTPRAGPFINLR
jgi:hypothetical protein